MFTDISKISISMSIVSFATDTTRHAPRYKKTLNPYKACSERRDYLVIKTNSKESKSFHLMKLIYQ